MNSKHKGFSLFELLLLLAILVIFVKLVIPKFHFINKFILQNELDKLYVTFSYLQHKAIASNAVQELVFDLDKMGYAYLEKDKKKFYKLPDQVLFGCLQNVLGPPSRPQKVIKTPVSFEQLDKNKFKVIFFQDGRISSGMVFLVDKDKKKLVSLSCSVSPFSCLRKYKYENNRWVTLK